MTLDKLLCQLRHNALQCDFSALRKIICRTQNGGPDGHSVKQSWGLQQKGRVRLAARPESQCSAKFAMHGANQPAYAVHALLTVWRVPAWLPHPSRDQQGDTLEWLRTLGLP